MNKKSLPKFKEEKEEQSFWQTHSSTDYIDWNKAKRAVFPNLKPSTVAISIRLPESLLNQIKVLANKRDIPYQSLMKDLLSQRVRDEQIPDASFHESAQSMKNVAKPKTKMKVLAQPIIDKRSSQPRVAEYSRVAAVPKKSLQVRESSAEYKAFTKKPKKPSRKS
jgi:predicted DNA binding CopG/RHH family protein